MLNQHRVLLHNNITTLPMQDLVQVMNIQVRDTETLQFIIHNNIHLSKGRFLILQGMLLPGHIQLPHRQALDQDREIALIVRNLLHHHTEVLRQVLIQLHPRLTQRLVSLLRPVQVVAKRQVQVQVQAQVHQVEVL